MYLPSSPLLLALLSWQLFCGLAFSPGAIDRCRRQLLKLQFDDFKDLDLSIGCSDANGKLTNGADLNAYMNDFPELHTIFQRDTISYGSFIADGREWLGMRLRPLSADL